MIDPPVLGRLMPWLARIALAIAVVCAVLLARRRAEYKPVAWALGAIGVANVVRPILFVLVMDPAMRAGRLPFQGAERLAFHVEQICFLVWPFGVAALAAAVFLAPRRWPAVAVLGAYVVSVGMVMAGYPTIRQDLLASVYLGLTLGCLAVALASVIWRWRAPVPIAPPEIAALLLVVFLLGTVLGPYAIGRVDSGWAIGGGLFAGLFGLLASLEVAWLRRR